MKNIFILVIGMALFQNVQAAVDSHLDKIVPVNDGPYVFLTNDKLMIMWVQNDHLRKNILTPKNFIKYKKKFGLQFEYDDLMKAFSTETCHIQSHATIDSIAVLADIHGEYATYVRSLRSTGVIDRDLNWSFGRGHLVILGDVFDRGDKVTEVLWHLFGLEKQAEKAGGRVHFLLGNHELMILTNDNHYISKKYRKVEQITGKDYGHLYSENSVIGKWLRSKPVMMSINDILFVHGGISPGMVKRNLSVEQVNLMFAEHFCDERDHDTCSDEQLAFLGDEEGPLWYRGYFTDSELNEASIDSILAFYGVNHIIVGHTSSRYINVKYSNKIIGTDTGIKYRQPGEMLLYKEGLFYRAYLNGRRIRIN